MGKKDEVDKFQDKLDEALMNERWGEFAHLIGEDKKDTNKEKRK